MSIIHKLSQSLPLALKLSFSLQHLTDTTNQSLTRLHHDSSLDHITRPRLKSSLYSNQTKEEMVLETVSEKESPPLIGPRISFSADLSDGGDFICISPVICKELEKGSVKVSDFEFLSENVSPQRMLTADELFSEGKLLPFWQVKHSEKLKNVSLKTNKEEDEVEKRKVEVMTMMMKNKEQESNSNSNRVSWFIDEDPSPRPPKCTVLWKELLRLKKQRNTTPRNVSSLSPSSSTSSSSSLEDAAKREEKEKRSSKKVLERTRSSSMKIRPMIHVPICTPSKSSVPLPPLFPISLKKNKLEKRT